MIDRIVDRAASEKRYEYVLKYINKYRVEVTEGGEIGRFDSMRCLSHFMLIASHLVARIYLG